MLQRRAAVLRHAMNVASMENLRVNSLQCMLALCNWLANHKVAAMQQR